ncbi:pre-mRNA-splicing factor 18 [Contarinia nasturtii]|uniref:pre-mRNA-splicing factor 18 n=1 Tax=Contarinia nasturtii TaxID=265458 RepID=UPI0012D404F7|nr:pre-mRNA-splicing factor 18 [Contarinia nasturtii]
MDILKAEIERKRKLLEDKNLVNSKKKFFRRGDLLAQEKETNSASHGKQNDNASTPEKSSDSQMKSNLSPEQKELPRIEVIRRLRDRNEPIRLFGESDRNAFLRLRHIEIMQPEVQHGFRNDFQEAMDEVDQQYLKEMLDSSEANHAKDNKQQEIDVLDESITYDEIQEMAKRLGRGNKDHDHLVISTLLEFLLKLWNAQVNSQKDHTTNVKIARATYNQTKVYMKPLLRKLKTRQIPDDILDSLTEIIKHLLSRNYIKASDAYLQMAIGNAPWPIGVTMVGIHARTGREKIFSKNVAHVMNDETQRKYIQGLKRLMTKCQEYFPTDPSRCVEYVNKNKN